MFLRRAEKFVNKKFFKDKNYTFTSEDLEDLMQESLGTIAPLVRLRAQGHTYEEIQEITGRTYGTLRTQVSQGLNKLKKYYCDNYAA